jgi:threonine dehydrogenase-like Zn-dependent dehydrogenase
MIDKLEAYRHPQTPLPSEYGLWPLYGAGLENMGVDGKHLSVPLPIFGPDELLIRHDACGLCFSDTKVIAQGEDHPRIQRDMKKEPVVLGHEVSFTIMGVGENLQNQYQVGDRFTLETDIVYQGHPMAYGYLIQGGLSQYSVIDKRVLQSDFGCYLIPVSPKRSYAEIALSEPWACVVAAYRLEYRTAIKPGGTLWIIGAGEEKSYSIGVGFNALSHPARLLLTNVPPDFARWLKSQAAKFDVEVSEEENISLPPPETVDDIILLGADPDIIEKVSPCLSQLGVLALMADRPIARKVSVDIGRIHYNRWVYIGSAGADIARAYQDVPVRSALRKGGKAWFIGAGGPMGRMHVQRAIQFSNPPATILCSDVSDFRLQELKTSFAKDAAERGIELICLNPSDKSEFERVMSAYQAHGFDDIIILAPVPSIIEDAAHWLAREGVMNIFAGVARGTLADLDLSAAYLKSARIIGHSASGMDDMALVIDKTNSAELSPIRSVAAIGSLSAARDGLKAVKDSIYAGKILIYPNITDFPLTALPDLKERLPSVYARLQDGCEWTNEAEEELLRIMLP